MKEMKTMKEMGKKLVIAGLPCKLRYSFIVFIPFILFISSCASVHQLTIEVQEPAPITFPVEIDKVLIVNNAAKQPGHSGTTRTCNGTVVEDPELDLDSVAWVAIVSLLSNINATHFFKEVSFYNESLREDNDWLVAAPLSKQFREGVFDKQDGIISIDRILITLNEQVVAKGMDKQVAVPYSPRSERVDTLKQRNTIVSEHIEAKLEAKLTCSVYLYDRESPLTTFTVSDTLSYAEVFFDNEINSFIIKELPEYLIDELAYNISEKLTYYFIPSWILKDRTVYSGANARMQEAFSYTKTAKWDKAEAVWLDEYARSSTKPADKGKLANNIAVANEMQDKLDIALRWAIQAQASFEESNLKAGSAEKLRINTYVEDLQKRIQDNQLLNLQWGKE
jgi:dihydroneopterin aldolase